MAVTSLISVKGAAEQAGVPESTMRRWAALGKVDATKVGKEWLIDPLSLKDVMRPATLRKRIQILIDLWSSYDEPVRMGTVPYLYRTEVVDKLREALRG